MTRSLLQRLASRALGHEARKRLRAAGPGQAALEVQPASGPMPADDQTPAAPLRAGPDDRPLARAEVRHREDPSMAAAAQRQADARHLQAGPAVAAPAASVGRSAPPPASAAPAAAAPRLPAQVAAPMDEGGQAPRQLLASTPTPAGAVPTMQPQPGPAGPVIPALLLPLQAQAPRAAGQPGIGDRWQGAPAAAQPARDASEAARGTADAPGGAGGAVDVYVTIGRVELALPPGRAGTAAPAPRAPSGTLSLADYLQGGTGRGRAEGRGSAGGRS